ncbi:hypothetical protein NM688_g5528 [Phlebia brevispora]|uniref:Uncharacterized protein n=1 Tax=Phlebia brevispora TaxID=194682 RepID=A0ACC1SU76_9APHY|nr:hypothetical protein NM688_g5528 [Phlebia brevispora]
MLSKFEERKASFKVPPASSREGALSQEARRKKALEEQKRRRAERFDSTRQLDLFADLNLGSSDDEDDKAHEPVREGVAQYASLLSNTSPVDSASFSPTPSSGVHPTLAGSNEQAPTDEISVPTSFGKKKGRNKRKSKATKPQSQPKKPSKWADKCMYAELLEMSEDTEMSELDTTHGDGIPGDIETSWVAVTPVPVGKRCLAITHAASGIAGIVPNTTLRSRVLGKSLMPPFPSSLPPHTILDCILDDNWRDNGILHVLDVLKWKGQDIADCETPFRFWWRDTRIAELPVLPPPNALPNLNVQPSSSSKYRFQYPVTVVPIPHHINLSLSQIADELIPLTRSIRHIPISIPLQQDTGVMDLDGISSSTAVRLHREMAPVQSDGMLLYMAHASYEPGTSPLSTWIPVRAYAEDRSDKAKQNATMNNVPVDGPLDVFERLIRCRLATSWSDTSMELL